MAAEMNSLSALERRVHNLENRNHHWRMATGLLVAIIGVTVLSGSVWKEDRRLDLRELRLVDDNGHARMLLTLTELGHPKILMVDPDGHVRAQYTSEALAFEDRGTPRVRLGIERRLQFFDDLGKRRAELSTDDGGSFLTLRPDSGKAFARIGISNTGEKFVTQSTAATTAER